MAGEASTHRPAGRRSHQALHEPAQELSRTIRATTRCSTSWRAPTKPRASRRRRWRRSIDVVRKYPQSPQIDEVQFRRGELLFSRKAITAGAESAYDYVVNKGDKAAFLDAEPVQARLVAVQAGPERREPAVVRGRARSHHAARRNRAQADPARQAAARQPRAGRRHAARHGGHVLVSTTTRSTPSTSSSSRTTTRPYAPILYSRLGDLYVEKERFQDAAAVYRAFATREPNSEFSPGLSMQAIEAYRKGGFTRAGARRQARVRRAVQLRHAVLAGPQQGRLPEHRQGAEDQPQGRRHVLPRRGAEVEEGRTSTARPRAGIAPTSNPSRTIRNPSARTTCCPRRCTRARTTRAPPPNSRRPPITTRAIRVRPPPLMPRSARTRSTKRDCRPPRSAEAHKLAVDAGVKFGTSFPEHPDSAGVLTRAAEDIFATQDLQRSIEVANLVLAHQPPADQPKRRIAYTIIGQANFDLLQFAEAEKGYIAARDLLPPNDKMRADLTERIASAVYRQGEAKQKAGDSLGRGRRLPAHFARSQGPRRSPRRPNTTRVRSSSFSRNGRAPSRCWSASAPTTPRASSPPTSRRKLAVAYRRDRPGRAGGGGIRAHRAEPGRDRRTSSARPTCRPRSSTRRRATRPRPSACSSASWSRIRRRSPIPSRRARNSPTSQAPRATSKSSAPGSARS